MVADMAKSPSKLVSVSTLLFFAALPVSAASVNVFDYNVIVTNTFTTSNHTEGAAFTKNINATNNPVFTNGNLYVAGTATGTGVHLNGTNFTNDVLYHQNALPTNFAYQNGRHTLDTTLSSTLTALTNSITSLSSGYASETQTAGATITIKENKNVSFNAPANAVGNVYFTLDLSKPGQNIFSLQNLNIAFTGLTAGSFAIVNVINAVTSTSINPTNFNFASQSAFTSQHVLWNFTNATSFTNNGAFYGTILGPNLTVNTNSRNIYGGVYVSNINQTAGEIHVPLFLGDLPEVPITSTPTIPLPSAALASSALFVCLALLRARREI